MKAETTALTMNCPTTKAEEYAAILYGCYRRTDADSPEIFLGAAIAVLSSYPESVVRSVCDPRVGLPARSKFPPNIYELTEACDAKMRPLLDAEARRRREAENAADRPTPLDDLALDRRKAVVARWREGQAIRDAKAAGAEMALADLDARKLHGEHRELVKGAIAAKLDALKADCHSSPLKLSPEALRAIAPELAPIS